MLDIVLGELKENRTIRNNIDSILLFSGIRELPFPTTSNPSLFREFLALKKEIKGEGESACLVYCKHYSDIIASSNTKDIKPYCEQHGMAYLTTLDIFCVAVAKGLITDTEVNTLIKKITTNNESHLCCSTIEVHRMKHFDSLKANYWLEKIVDHFFSLSRVVIYPQILRKTPEFHSKTSGCQV